MGYFKSKETEENYKAAKKQGGLTRTRKHKEIYYKNPKRCKFCNKEIKYKRRDNIFCDRSCATSFNNLGVSRHGVALKDRPKNYCTCCGNIIGRNSTKFCSNKCSSEYTYLIFINKWKLGLESGNFPSGGTSNYIKRYILEKFNNKCTTCKIDIWNGKSITLELEHNDGNSTNNLEDNLCVLCPNCHSQTPTYKGANIGQGRHYRRKRYKKGLSY